MAADVAVVVQAVAEFRLLMRLRQIAEADGCVDEKRLAELVADCEQVLVTAAVGADVPERLRSTGRTYAVTLGEVTRVD